MPDDAYLEAASGPLGLREQVRREMTRQGATQAAVAAAVGCTQVAVSRLLSGARNGHAGTWEALADALGCEWRLSRRTR